MAIASLFGAFRFERRKVATGVAIAFRIGGEGPPLLLLHGMPQSHVMWAKVAPRLARRFTLVMPDLRGYGDSDKPPTEADHAPYSFRAMAEDQVALMESLGHARFAAVGHDRGARTLHRMALDHPDRVLRAILLDILPTLATYEATDMGFAMTYYHWFFLTQRAPLPERLIAGDPIFYLRHKMTGWSGDPVSETIFDPACMAEYERCYRDPAMVHAMCEDYRAGATIDLAHDRADRAAGRRLGCPVHVMWGERNPVWRGHDMLGTWRACADGPVTGRGLPAGHYLAEERPNETAEEIERFLG
ncbi:MAG: alpha/beta hydrolase [Alphaproteobacteria bacterium]